MNEIPSIWILITLLSFDTEQQAIMLIALLTTKPAIYNSLSPVFTQNLVALKYVAECHILYRISFDEEFDFLHMNQRCDISVQRNILFTERPLLIPNEKY